MMMLTEVSHLEQQNIALREKIDLLEEQIRQLRKTLIPRILFPLEWQLNRGESGTLASLYTAPDGFRSTETLRAASDLFGHGSGAQIVGVRIYTLRAKLRPFGIQIETRFAEGYQLSLTNRLLIKDAIEKEAY